MSTTHGRFVWYELMTTDIDAAQIFYGKAVGWTAKDSGMSTMTYFVWSMGETSIGGLMTLPDELRQRGVPPCWTGHIGVDDVDATAAQAQRLGGTIRHAPTDIPKVGRFAIIADPDGAVFSIFKWSAEPGAPHAPPFDLQAPGHVGWHELLAADPKKAFAVYSELFGWKTSREVDIGAMGTYHVFSHDGADIGGMFAKPPQVPGPFWLFYINVPAVEPAAERVKANGGKILHGPMEVPTGSWVAQCADPAGAVFALVGKRN